MSALVYFFFFLFFSFYYCGSLANFCLLPLGFFHQKCWDCLSLLQYTYLISTQFMKRIELLYFLGFFLHSAPLQADMEQEHVLGWLCTNAMQYQKIHTGNEQCICTESHLNTLTGLESYILAYI